MAAVNESTLEIDKWPREDERQDKKLQQGRH